MHDNYGYLTLQLAKMGVKNCVQSMDGLKLFFSHNKKFYKVEFWESKNKDNWAGLICLREMQYNHNAKHTTLLMKVFTKGKNDFNSLISFLKEINNTNE